MTKPLIDRDKYNRLYDDGRCNRLRIRLAEVLCCTTEREISILMSSLADYCYALCHSPETVAQTRFLTLLNTFDKQVQAQRLTARIAQGAWRQILDYVSVFSNNPYPWLSRKDTNS